MRVEMEMAKKKKRGEKKISHGAAYGVLGCQLIWARKAWPVNIRQFLIRSVNDAI